MGQIKFLQFYNDCYSIKLIENYIERNQKLFCEISFIQIPKRVAKILLKTSPEKLIFDILPQRIIDGS